jgi:hypothetical protein
MLCISNIKAVLLPVTLGNPLDCAMRATPPLGRLYTHLTALVTTMVRIITRATAVLAVASR